MADGRGWYGDPEGHSRAAKKANASWPRRRLMELREWLGGLVGGD